MQRPFLPILPAALRTLPAVAALSLTAISVANPQAINYGASVSSDGVFGDGTNSTSRISDSGRYVVFASTANDLVPNDQNNVADIFRHDLQTGVTELVSQGMSGNPSSSNGTSLPDLSGDGRFVVFSSLAGDIVPGDTNTIRDIFVRDMLLEVTERVNLTSTGAEASIGCHRGRITPDGRYVVFETRAPMTPDDTNFLRDIYRFDRQLNQLDRVSVTASGDEANSLSERGAISDDGQRIAFSSHASNLVVGDTNNNPDIFLKDMITGAVTRMSTDAAGQQALTFSLNPSISGDGGTVAFSTVAATLVPGDTNGKADFFAKDVATGAIERLNVRPNGNQINHAATGVVSLSTDGNLAAFDSLSGALVPNDTNGRQDCFIRNRAAQSTVRVSLAAAGGALNDHSFDATISGDGDFVCFASLATNVAPGDPLQTIQIYAVDRFGSGSVGTPYCSPTSNSTGLPGELSAIGTSVASYNQITLSATQLPPNAFGLLLVSRQQGFNPNPGGSFGNFCLGGSIGRYVGPGEVQDSGAAGRIDLTIDLNAMPQPTGFDVAAAGDEWNFQLWHRDSNPFGSANSNFTRGLSVVLR